MRAAVSLMVNRNHIIEGEARGKINRHRRRETYEEEEEEKEEEREDEETGGRTRRSSGRGKGT